MNTEEAIAAIEEALSRIPGLRRTRAFSAEHVEFLQTTGLELGRIFGPDSAIVENFHRIQYRFSGSFVAGFFDLETEEARRHHEAYLHGVEQAEGILRSARSQLSRHGVEALLAESRVKLHGGRVFISHGTETPALTKIERFIRALGLNPVIVDKTPSEGMSVDDLVERRMSESNCAIILATADEEVAGRRQPRPNVIHEIGLAQEKLRNKVIYLKETGCAFPSNVRPKVWGTFTQENLEEAFEKIAMELRAFGLA
jgi:hypothetical protein